MCLYDMVYSFYYPIGVRIDYVLASCDLEQEFTFADIRNDIMGSDHCPVYADLRDDSCVISNASDSEPSAILAANFDEFSNRQKKLSMYFGAKSTTDTNNNISASSSQLSKSSIGIGRNSTATTAISQSSRSTKTTPSPKKRKSSVSTSGSQKLLKSYFTSDKESTPNPSSSSSTTTTTPDPASQSTNDDTIQEDDTIIDMDALMAEAKERQDTKASWSTLFTARPPPKCRVHQEPCKLMVVNKKGPNQGRQFYLCSRQVSTHFVCYKIRLHVTFSNSRPYGPENSTAQEYQCNFFQWKTSSQEKSNHK